MYNFKRGADDNKNATMVIGILLVLIVVIGALLIFILSEQPGNGGQIGVGNQNQTIIPDMPPDNSTTNDTVECDDQCHYDLALLNIDVGECNTIIDGAKKQECYSGLSTLSLDACILLDNLTVKTHCAIDFAIETDDRSICELLGENAQACYDEFDKCLDADDEDLCYALRNEDPSECKELSCQIKYSIAKNDGALCDMVSGNAATVACRAAVKQSDLCYDLSSQFERDYCYQLYAIYTDEILMCSQITSDTHYIVDCYASFAISRGNVSICNRASVSLDSRWDCYTNYSLMSGDIAGCYAIDELATTSRFACAFEFAKLHGDPSGCQAIVYAPSRTTCYQGSILYLNDNLDYRNCANITDFDWNHKCYNEAAKVQDDIAICDNIDVPYAKEACQIAYNVYKENNREED